MTTKLTDKNISNVSNLGISWQAVIVADGSTATSVEAGKGYFIDTTSNAHTVTLPSSANAGDTIAIKDYAGTFATNNLTISRNGHNIQGVANNSLISTNRANVELAYIDSTKGWLFTNESNVADLQLKLYVTATGGTVTTTGNDKIHTFTGDGCFVVSCGGNTAGSDSVDYLVVAGGGGGGRENTYASAGGGAGGYRTSFPGGTKITTPATTYPVTVGAGGAGGSGAPRGDGYIGGSSIFSTITSTGGGGGRANNCAPSPTGGPFNGGSGGGAWMGGPAGAGNTPPVSPPQGNPGGLANQGGDTAGGGGGGASAAGSNATAPPSGGGGAGGAGSPNSISGSSVNYAGGGGGGSGYVNSTSGSGGAGGAGGGGAGSAGPTSTAGTSNTGGGGGGTRGISGSVGSAGGSGIVIIRYKFQN